MSALTTPIHYCTGNPSYSNQEQNKYKYQNFKGTSKIVSICGKQFRLHDFIQRILKTKKKQTFLKVEIIALKRCVGFTEKSF